MSGSIYIAEVIIDPPIEAKIQGKHNLTAAQVREAIQYPAKAESAFDSNEEHGPRWLVVGECDGRSIVAAVLPVPSYEGPNAETWVLKTARWV